LFIEITVMVFMMDILKRGVNSANAGLNGPACTYKDEWP